MAFSETLKNGLKTVGHGIKVGANAVKTGWNKGWDFLEKFSVNFTGTYELRDFKSTSSIGIIFAFIAIFFGIFYMSINMTTMRLVIGSAFLSSVADFFLFFALVFLIAGTLTASPAGLVMICGGMCLPLVGEILYMLFMLVTGKIGDYFASRWLHLVAYLFYAGTYVLTFFRIISVKIARYLLSAVTLAVIVVAVLSFSLEFSPFYGYGMGEVKGVTDLVECPFVYVTYAFEFITVMLSMLSIHLTVFDYTEEEHNVSNAKVKEEVEEF